MNHSRCAHCENLAASSASVLWHKMEIQNPQDPGELEMDVSANVGRLFNHCVAVNGRNPYKEGSDEIERAIDQLFGTSDFKLQQKYTDSELASIWREFWGKSGNTNFPDCICPPKERNGRTPEDDYVDSDFCAVYLPERRETHQREIWISVRGAACFARSLSGICSANGTSEEINVVCRVFLYHHEIFHFNVDRALRRLGVNIGAGDLWWNAYVASWGTYDCIEEGMAEAFALQRMKRLPERYHGYIEPLKTLILKSTPGYSSGVAIAERYEEFKRFFFRKVADVTGMDQIHEAEFLKMLEDDTPPDCRVFYVMPVTEEQKQHIIDCRRLWALKDAVDGILGPTDPGDISGW